MGDTHAIRGGRPNCYIQKSFINSLFGGTGTICMTCTRKHQPSIFIMRSMWWILKIVVVLATPPRFIRASDQALFNSVREYLQRAKVDLACEKPPESVHIELTQWMPQPQSVIVRPSPTIFAQDALDIPIEVLFTRPKAKQYSIDSEWLMEGDSIKGWIIKPEKIKVPNNTDITTTRLRLLRTRVNETPPSRVDLRFTHSSYPINLIHMSVPISPISSHEYHILSLNDFHGRIGTDARGLMNSRGVLLASKLNELRELYDKTSQGHALVAVGDNVGGSQYEVACLNEKPALDFFNLLDVKLSAVGNHEFDKGLDFYLQHIRPIAKFPYMGANVESEQDSPFIRSFILTLGEGNSTLKVGVIGVTTIDLPRLVASNMTFGLHFSDSVEAMNNQVPSLKAQGVDLIIALCHQGGLLPLKQEIEMNSEFARLVTRADPSIVAVLTGHTHKSYVATVPINSAFKYRVTMQSGCCGEYIGDLKIQVEADTKQLVGLSATNHVVESRGQNVSVSPEIIALLNDTLFAHRGQEVVGHVSVPLLHPRRDKETPLCNTVADAMLESLEAEGWDIDLALQNPGGVRSSLIPTDGLVTVRDIATVLSFANPIVIVPIKGSLIHQLLEEQWQEDGVVLHICFSSNLNYWYDSSKPRQQRVNDIHIDGDLIDNDRVYRLATTSFIASGGDRFSVISHQTTKTGLTDESALTRYIQRRPILLPDYMERAIDQSLILSNITFCLTPSGQLHLISPVNITLTTKVLDATPQGLVEIASFPQVKANVMNEIDVSQTDGSVYVALAMGFDQNIMGNGIVASQC
eukprot:Blabericola_migrator_1__9535@NODE_518_length_7920_cov_188_180568_g396_i0_p1_GENE_NODE_518_length_7920_cov_188_180568_g396_i0NODE_518_length_7920_cov_188_180568_g396_i0_p1_ORF_typecomplete_len805_score119_095_nucleotid_C/PF02872_18/2_6e325_nucleotid_C/PF02872_18/8_4e02Metallophos/PF00149_28/2_9e05Metallophos/PF00149_28/9_8e03Metallophos_2/PF12850_7/0_0045_NODE_518_length_7920_cov_188_180568_g396_i045997013